MAAPMAAAPTAAPSAAPMEQGENENSKHDRVLCCPWIELEGDGVEEVFTEIGSVNFLKHDGEFGVGAKELGLGKSGGNE